MTVIDKTISIDELKNMASSMFGDMVKAVVDTEQDIIAVDAELHADLEALLLKDGSKQQNLWGINLYPDMDEEDFIEFDSMINVRPSQGNMSRSVDDEGIQEQIRKLVDKRVVK